MTDTNQTEPLQIEQLAPCPWCGPAVAVNTKSSSQFRWWVACYGGCRGLIASSEAEAIAAWNDRDHCTRADALREAASGLLDRLSSTYTDSYGCEVGIEADDGEKCWIVHSDDIDALRAALSDAPQVPDEAKELREALKLLDNVTATDSTADDLGCAELAIQRALAAMEGQP